MRKRVFCLLVISALLLGIVGFGCNGGRGTSTAITVSLQPSGTQAVSEGQTLTVTAAVHNDSSHKGVTWSLTGAGSLSNQTPNSVDYLAPANVSSTATATVTATSVTNTAVSARVTITVNPAPALTIRTTSLPNGTVGFPYTGRLQAFGGVSPYTWSVSSGSLPSWANLDSAAGIISGTPNSTGTSIFTVKVSDSQATPASATQQLSIAIGQADSTNNAELKGQYAFLLQGFDDATGNQFAIVGSFTADGNGNLTSGLEDINGPDGYQPEVTFTGTYSVGADNRGQASLTNSLGASTKFAIAVGLLNSSNVATQASLIEFDDSTGINGKRGSGFAYMQDSSTFSLSSIKGPYAFQFVGQTGETDTRLALTGAYTADGNGNLNGEVDSNIDGVMEGPQTFASTISASQGTDTSSFGRMTTTPTGASFHFVYYIVSSSKALVMSTDPESTSGLLGGEVMAQASSSFSASSLNSTAVGYGVGTLTIHAGLWKFDGAGTALFSLGWGTAEFYEGIQSGSLSYTVDSSGRVKTTGSSAVLGVPGVPIFYLVDNNKGFLMSTDSSVTTGFFEPQTGGPFSNASLSGNYFFGTVPPAAIDSAVASGVGTSTGDGTLNLTIDESEPTYYLLSEGRSADVSVTINAQGKVTNNNPWLIGMVVGFMISDDKAVIMLNAPRWAMITIFQR
jgi:hypothetical protein